MQILKNILSKFDAEPREETNTDEAQAAAHDDDVDNNGDEAILIKLCLSLYIIDY